MKSLQNHQGDYCNLVELLEDDNGVCGGRSGPEGSAECMPNRWCFSASFLPFCSSGWSPMATGFRNVDNPNRLLKARTAIPGRSVGNVFCIQRADRRFRTMEQD